MGTKLLVLRTWLKLIVDELWNLKVCYRMFMRLFPAAEKHIAPYYPW